MENYTDQNLETWSKACKLITDGKGALKVATNITLNFKTKLKARSANKKDEALLLKWANDPLVRRNSFNLLPVNDSQRSPSPLCVVKKTVAMF